MQSRNLLGGLHFVLMTGDFTGWRCCSNAAIFFLCPANYSGLQYANKIHKVGGFSAPFRKKEDTFVIFGQSQIWFLNELSFSSQMHSQLLSGGNLEAPKPRDTVNMLSSDGWTLYASRSHLRGEDKVRVE